MNYAKKRPSSRKRHIAPAVVASGIGLLGSLIGIGAANKRAKKAKEDAEEQARQQLLMSNIEGDKAAFEEIETQGIDNVEYYPYGGKMNHNVASSTNKEQLIEMFLNGGTYEMSPFKGRTSQAGFATKGGTLVPIADDVDLAVGNKHAENNIDNTYGIKLLDGGKAVAEIEDGEVLADGNVVFSDQLMYDNKNSFADKMVGLAKKRNRLDKKLETNMLDKRGRNSVEKQLANLNMAEEALFTKQEMKKFEKGSETLDKVSYGGKMDYKYGGKMPYPVLKGDYLRGKPIKFQEGGFFDSDFGQGLAEAAPSLLDNITNALLTANTPELSTPLLNKPRNLDTQININPQLAAVRRGTRATTRNIMDNTSSSSIARNAIANAQLRGAESESKIRANKENIETQLRNQNIINRQRTGDANRQIMNRHMFNEFERQADIQSKISANVANLGEDIGNFAFNRNMQKVDDERLLNELLDDPTGAKLRALENNPYVKQRIRRNKNLRDALNNIRRNRFNPVNVNTSLDAYLYSGMGGLS